MPKELFNQTVVSSPAEPADDDRIAFGKPGVSGAKNILWSRFKQILQGALEWLDLIPQSTPPAEQESRFYYDNVYKAYSAYTEITGVAPFRFGRVLRSRVYNQSGVTIPKGSICKIVGLSGTSPIIELADSSDINDVKLIVGIAMHDIATFTVAGTGYGYLAVFDTVIGVDTSGMSANDLIYADPTTPGGFTNIEPAPPYASYPIGFVSIVDAVNGVIGVRVGGFTGSDTSINLKGVLNGVITQTPKVIFNSDGITITATVSNDEVPGESLPFILNDVRYLLPTGQSVTVPPGADSETLQSSIIYIYLNGGVPTLAIATTPPSIPYCTVCEVSVFDAIRTQSMGRPFIYRRSNNAVDALNGVNDGALGLFIRTVRAIRKKLGSNWISGQDATPTVNNTTIKVALTSGRGMQFNEFSVPSFDGNSYIIYNDTSNNVTYQASTNLTDITVDASGNNLVANNKYYTIRLFQLLNSNGIGNSIIATRPLNSYTTLAEAIQDPNNYTINVNAVESEEIIYPLYDLVIARTGTGTTINLGQLTDLRTKIVGAIGGGGASGGGGTDDKVRISATDTNNDYLNPKFTPGDEFTKEITNPTANETLTLKFKNWFFNVARTFKLIFNVESLTVDRTVTWPNKDITVAGLFNVRSESGSYVETIIFDTEKTVSHTQTTDISLALSVSGNIAGVEQLYKITGNGVNSIEIDRETFLVSGEFDNTDENHVFLYYSHNGDAYAIIKQFNIIVDGNYAPVANTVAILSPSGLLPGAEIQLAYNYSDVESDIEDDSVTGTSYKLTRYDSLLDAQNDINGTILAQGATLGATQYYTLQSADASKFLLLQIIPKAETGTRKGVPYYSSIVETSAPFSITDLGTTKLISYHTDPDNPSNVVLDVTAPVSVEQWLDLSGNSRHFVQATKARQPVVNVDALQTDGSDDIMSYSVATTANLLIFIVVNLDAYSNLNRLLDAVGTARFLVQNGQSFTYATSKTLSYSTYVTTGEKELFQVEINGASSSFKDEDGNEVTGTLDALNITAIQLANRPELTAGTQGKFYDIVILNRDEVTTDDITNVRNSLLIKHF